MIIVTQELNRLQPFTVEYITQGLICERSSDGLLNIFVFECVQPPVLEMLEKQIERIFAHWIRITQPCLLLYDLRKADARILEALRTQVIILLEKFDELRCYLAFVLPEDMEIETPCRQEPRCLITTFTSRDEATFWLLKIIEVADSV